MKNYLLILAGVTVLCSIVFLNFSKGNIFENDRNIDENKKLQTSIKNNDKKLNEKKNNKSNSEKGILYKTAVNDLRIIGTNASNPVDNPSDNTINFFMENKLPDDCIVLLEYSLYGAQGISVCKSINENLTTGGKIIKKNEQWTKQMEFMSPDWFKQGENRIRFSKPEGYDLRYKIKNVSITVKHTQKESGIQITHDINELYDEKYAYVNGFIYGIENCNVERVYANNQELSHNNGMFEGVIFINKHVIDNKHVNVELKDGRIIRTPLKIDGESNSDYVDLNKMNVVSTTEIAKPAESFDVRLNAFYLDAPKGSVFEQTSISITGLRNIDMPLLDPSMVNVTSDNAGYRCLPHGKHFNKDINVFIDYDSQKIPSGYGPSDIRTFYYNDSLQKWEMLDIVDVDIENNTIQSKTNHFTDFINAIIKTPELPQTEAFTPTSMKDEAYADPLSGFNIMKQPSANNKGTVNLSFPLQVPKGRQGMQPDLALNYSSDAGNTWLGVGWNLTLPAITIDNSWGVPRFSDQKETEAYLLNGEQIVELNGTVISDRFLLPQLDSVYRDRGPQSETYYAYRIEGKFYKIIRHGTTTDEYWWEVIDKHGTRYLYGKFNSDTGVNDSCVLRQPETDNIAHWALAEVRDVYGNYIKYEYTIFTLNNPPYPGEGGQQIYPKKISYTGFNTTDGPYSIDFNTTTRDDYSISGRNGLLEVTRKKLESIDIKFDNQFVRKYKLNYSDGAYDRTILKSIADITDSLYQDLQVDCENLVQHFGATVHCFDYYEEEGVEFSTVGTEVINTNEEMDLVFNGQYSDSTIQSIGRSKGTSVSFGGSACLGIGVKYPSKFNSFGINYNRTIGNNSQKVQFIDINGDGLTDKLVLSDDHVDLYKGKLENNEFSFENTAVEIPSLDNMGQSKSKTNTFGGEILAMGGSLSYNHTVTKSMNTAYFSDINNDGFIDFVKDGDVLLNTIDNDDNPVFTPLANGPAQYYDEDECYYMYYDGDITSFTSNTGEGEIEQRRDPVIMWRVPEDGDYKIEFPLQRVNIDPYVNGSVDYGFQINEPPSFYGECRNIGRDDTVCSGSHEFYRDANRGEVIFFRLHPNQTDGRDDVDWDVKIKGPLDNQNNYPDIYDANENHIYVYNYAEENVIHDNQVFSAPFNGVVTINSELNSIEQSDSLNYSIIYREWDESNGEFLDNDTIANAGYPSGNQIDNEVFQFSDFNINEQDQLVFVLECQSNINWSDIDFDALIDYDYYEVEGNIYYDEVLYYPSLNMTIYQDRIRKSHPVDLIEGETYTVYPHLNLDAYFSGTIVLTAKSTRQLLGSVEAEYNNGSLLNPVSFDILVTDDDTVYFDYFATEPDIYDNVIESEVKVVNGGSQSFDAGFFTKYPDDDCIFGNLFRGWGQFSYLPDNDYGDCMHLVHEDDLFIDTASVNEDFFDGFNGFGIDNNSTYDDVVNAFDNNNIPQDNIKTFAVMRADRENDMWVDFYHSAYIKHDTIGSGLSSTDLLETMNDTSVLDLNEEFTLPDFNNPIPGGSGLVPNKQSKQISNSFSFGAGGAGPVNFSETFTFSSSEGLTDFMDINGDGFPDIVGSQKIQYSSPQGGMSDLVLDFGDTVLTSIGSGEAMGGSFGVKGTKQQNKNPGVEVKGLMDNIDGSYGIGGNTGVNDINFIYADFNGDGLPDRLNAEDNEIQYNTGYGFLPVETLTLINSISNTQSISGSLSIGLPQLNLGQFSFSTGFGGSLNTSFDKYSIMDVNNDGLSDFCIENSDTLYIYINNITGYYITGNSQYNNEGINKNISSNISSNISATYGIPILPSATIPLKLTFSGYADVAYNLNADRYRLTDLNGDGYMDYVYVDNNNIKAKYGIPKKTNILKKVKTPGKSTYAVDYEMNYPCTDNPNSKWVMSSLAVYDGFDGDGEDMTYYKFDYQNPEYHRYEKEFLGFETVITEQYDDFNNDDPYRSFVEKYHTDCYIFKGLKKYEATYGPGGENEKYVETVNSWAHKDIATGVVIDPETADCFGPYYPAINEIDEYYYEGGTTAHIHTKKSYKHGEYGNVTQYTNAGNVEYPDDNIRADIHYDNDPANNFLNLPDRLDVLDHNGDLLQQRIAGYDSNGRISEIKNYNGSSFAITNLSYDNYGNVSTIKYPEDVNDQRLTYHYEYDDAVHTYPVKITDFWGNFSTADYDYKLGLPVLITDRSGNDKAYSYYPNGKINTITGPKEIEASEPFTIKCEYWSDLGDQNQYLWAKTRHYDPLNSNNEFITVNFSDGLGRSIQSKKKETVDGTDKAVVSGRIEYDHYGRSVTVSQPITENPGNWTDYTPNNSSNVSTVTYDVLDRKLVNTDFDGTTVEHKYSFGNDGFGHTCFRTEVIDQNNIPTFKYTDARGRETQIKAPEDATTKFKYSPIGELIRTIDPEGNITYYDYDMLGNLLVRDHPDANKTIYTYDLAGNVLTLQTENLISDNEEIEYTYHDCRLVKIHYPINPEMDVFYKYGPPNSGNQTGRLIRRQDASGVQEFYYGNMGELIKNIHTFVVPGGYPYTFKTEWNYDSWNRLRDIKYPDGEKVQYDYNNAGKLNKMKGEKGGYTYKYIEDVRYDKYGKRKFIKYGNTTEVFYTYNELNQRLELLNSKDHGGHNMQNIHYVYDDAGNIMRIENHSDYVAGQIGGNYQYNYDYDDLYRLKRSYGKFDPEEGVIGFELGMKYSPSGNILRKSLKAHTLINEQINGIDYENEYSYPYRPHTVDHAGPAGYKWDKNGNQIYRENQYGARRLCWDEENRLSAIHNHGEMSNLSVYLYDDAGDRTWKLTGEETQMQINGVTTYSNVNFDKTLYTSPYLVMTEHEYTKHYFIEGERVCSKLGGGFGPAEVPPTSEPLEFIAGDEDEIAIRLHHLVHRNIDCTGYSGEWEIHSGLEPAHHDTNDPEYRQYFYHPDHLGSSSFITERHGEAEQHLQYLPFGELFTSQRNHNYDSRYKFSAKELDDESGYTYFGARYYDPELSNWLSVDPLADDYPSLSPYAYVANNPVGFVDPNGEDIVPTNKGGEKATYHLIQKYNKGNIFQPHKYPMKKGGQTYSKYGSDHTKNPYENKSQFQKAMRKSGMKIKGDDLDEAWGLFNALVSKNNYEVEAWKPNESTTFGESTDGTKTVENVVGYPTRQTENDNFWNAVSEEATPGNIENLFQQKQNDTRAEKSGEGFLYYQNKTQNPRKAGTKGIIILDDRKNTTKSLGNALKNIFE